MTRRLEHARRTGRLSPAYVSMETSRPPPPPWLDALMYAANEATLAQNADPGDDVIAKVRRLNAEERMLVAAAPVLRGRADVLRYSRDKSAAFMKGPAVARALAWGLLR